ncbi:peroxisomal membrane protein PMP34 isoform X2 [Bombyx mori]|uniref:peroxisomal membrane protein PMP34 isoform X2 n=1 Tax=Bombyx mori TaxID=7091 RepID=UPI002ED20103
MTSLLSYETLVHAIAGATGSVVGMTIFYPLDTLRSRIQVEDSKKLQGSTLELLIKLANEEAYRRPLLNIGLSNRFPVRPVHCHLHPTRPSAFY